MATLEQVQENLQAREIEQRIKDLKWMLEHEQGRRILFDLIEGTRAFETSFTGNSGSYFNDGRKSVGLEFFHEVMGISPESFTLMWNEHQDRLQQRERELADSEDL